MQQLGHVDPVGAQRRDQRGHAQGLQGGVHAHGDTPYRVTGVLAPCGCVLDRLIVTASESVWQVHEKTMATDEEDRKALEANREVTMALVRYRTPLAAAAFPRYVNSQTPMQAAAPAIEVTRLLPTPSMRSSRVTSIAGAAACMGVWLFT